ncbi:PIG-L family deacetylase [Streptomyces cinnamoneus]|uniref:PIG-L family deacetylase n=1 Tax=Streptomyces cinnamoneus TaxID=53446 RepID=A0A2G1XLK0_STRCJ|nr:PIG-L family deacetylase [Streptomyces cinnamoneus]PHQ52100.1 PIG-L family deacetylase [Streptomyces cinnamoneus]PPT16180.1 PIG-L family deacetylase [Streptomyces cinnamoneus]
MPGRIPRRRVLQIAGGTAVVGAGAVGTWQWLAPEDKGRPGSGEFPARPAKAVTSEAVVHVMAHEDDSLFFMNPELEQSIRSGAPTLTVCMTGGESDGRNALSTEPGYDKLPMKRPEFVRARMNGLREATAQMATGDWLSPWTVETLRLLPGLEVELQTLKAAPQIQLIFMELVEARAIKNPKKESLRGLWLGAAPDLTTLVPAGGPVRKAYRYTRQQVIDTLTAVFERYQPTVVRTLDPNPTHRAKQPEFPGTPPVLQGISHYDHQDHTASAYFAQAALAQFWGRKHSRPVAVDTYVGYEVDMLPNSLDDATTAHKIKILDTYGWVGDKDCGDKAGCGDRKVGNRGRDYRWSNNLRHRATGTQRWVQPLPDGRLAAFAVLDGQAQCWTETKAGSGVWSQPASVGGSMLEGQVQVLRRSDGSLQLFSVRTVLPAKGEDHRREIVTARQEGKTPDGGTPAFAAWESLGSPDADPERSMETGYPVAVEDKDGSVHVFVKNFDGGVSFRSSASGQGWRDWAALPAVAGDVRIEDGIDVALDNQGRIHVVAADTKTVHHWVSEPGDAAPKPAGATRLPAATGPLTLTPLSGGGIRLAMRQPVTSRVVVADLAAGGGWRVTSECEAFGGYGRVALAQVENTTVIAARDDKGRVRLSVGSGRPGPWQDGGVPHRATAALAQDAQGRTVVVALGTDGRLSSTRGAGSGSSSFGDWIGHDGQVRKGDTQDS